jgi:hypothetical protein
MARDRFGFSERHGFGEHEQGGWSLRRQINALPIPALFPVQDLLRCAKHLFIAAMVAIVPAQGRSSATLAR